MKKNHAIKILIADDHQVVREGLVAIINRQPDMTVVAEAENGREAIDKFRACGPDVALIDVRMPRMDGIGVIAAIRAPYPSARIIVLTTFDTDEDIYRAFRAGAKAYLLKDVPREELLSCIRTVYSGHNSLPQLIASKLAERMSGTELSDREMDVLRLMAVGKSNKEIARSLHIAEGTTKVHVNSILHKLGVTGRTEAVSVAVKHGLVRLE